jgi:hypothetical protein
MQGMIAFANVEFSGIVLFWLTTWRHLFPVREVPFAATAALLAQAKLAYPAAHLRSALLSKFPCTLLYQYQREKFAVGTVESTAMVVLARTEDGFQFTTPERRGAMND